jgi:hypothetical protein
MQTSHDYHVFEDCELLDDTHLSAVRLRFMRWVVVAPPQGQGEGRYLGRSQRYHYDRPRRAINGKSMSTENDKSIPTRWLGKIPIAENGWRSWILRSKHKEQLHTA